MLYKQSSLQKKKPWTLASHSLDKLLPYLAYFCVYILSIQIYNQNGILFVYFRSSVSHHVSWLHLCLQMVQNAYFSNATMSLINAKTGISHLFRREGDWIATQKPAFSQLTTDIFIHFFELPFAFFSLHTFSSLPLSFKGKVRTQKEFINQVFRNCTHCCFSASVKEIHHHDWNQILTCSYVQCHHS